jgi:uncharacterized protein
MSGTSEGGKAAAVTNRARHGKDFYKRIGADGGKNSTTGGFWHAKHVLKDDQFIRDTGALGGRVSKRKKKEN